MSGPPDRPGVRPAQTVAIARRSVVAASAAAVAAGIAACGTSGASGAAPEARRSSRPVASSPTSTPSHPAHRPQAGILSVDGPDIAAGSRTTRSIALTFHGQGPAGMAERLLDIVKAHQVHVTVFAVGIWADANPALLRRFLAEGHDLGNHTWSHRPMRTLSAAEADSEVARGAAAVAAARGAGPGALFRPSGTPTSTPVIRAAARRAGYHRCISYDVDSLDYTDPGPAAVTRNVLDAVRNGSIISLHMGHQGTLDALPTLLDSLMSKGFRPHTVTSLLAEPGEPVVVTA